jgi:hypothetical protein
VEKPLTEEVNHASTSSPRANQAWTTGALVLRNPRRTLWAQSRQTNRPSLIRDHRSEFARHHAMGASHGQGGIGRRWHRISPSHGEEDVARAVPAAKAQSCRQQTSKDRGGNHTGFASNPRRHFGRRADRTASRRAGGNAEVHVYSIFLSKLQDQRLDIWLSQIE